jgi:hypothetical protein
MATTLSGQLDLGSATEGTALASNTDVASFSDDNLTDTASAFTATIDWGDGTTTAGTIVGSNGSFTVDGGHTYADEGFPTATVNVTRTADNTQLSMVGTVPVADADNLTGHSAPTIAANPNQVLTNVTVATFTDTYTGNTAADFTTSIDWGDGTTTTGILSGSGGNFTVTGSHTYASAGQFTITTFMNDDGPDSAVGVATTTAAIGFGGNGVAQEVTEGTSSGPVTVATFSDNASLPASDYTATIDWGDGTTTGGTVSGSSNSFSVTGSHTYSDEGNFTSTTTVTRTTDNAHAIMSGPITVDEGDALTASGTTINGDLVLSNVKVATFTDALTTNVASDFVATIDWGDGTTTGGIVSGSGGAFSISGSHTYAQGGQYTVLADVQDDTPGFAEDTATSTAKVGLFNGAGGTFNGTEGTAASGTTATFSDGDTADTASAFIATIDWGDGTTTPGTVTGSNGLFSVQGTHAYSDEGNFATTTTVTRTADSSHLTITGSVSAAEADSLILAPNSFTANPGQALNNVPVATFSDTFTGNTASDFSATINWGDGTFSAGTVTGSGALFTVSGSHTYTSGGSFSVTTTASDDAPGTANATGTGTATVNLAGTMTLTAATEAVALANNTPVATFSDSNGGDTPASFTAAIDWGDGVTSAGTVSGGAGTFTVSGGHTYADEGNDQASVTLTRTADQATSTISGSVAVAEHDSLTGQAVAISGAAHHALTNVTVATFTDTDTVTPASDFVATIDWGDGTTTAGTITGSNGAFAVHGSHTYTTAGHDNVTVTMSDDAPGTATATVTSSATIGFGPGNLNDFNADGFSDFLWQTDGGNLAIWEMNNFQISAADYTRLGSSQVGLPGPDWHIVDTGDFDGDGKADILWRTDSGATAIWEMDGTHIKTADFIRNGSTVVGAPGPDWHELGAADFDGDGKADILWRTDSGALAIWEMDGTHIKTADFIRNGSTAVGVPAPDWKIVGVGDFDGDGNNDLLWETGGGQLAVWEMNGTHIKSADYIKNGPTPTGIPGSDWHVADVGDFDGDGKADILWRVGPPPAAVTGAQGGTDPGGSQVAIWEMNGNQIKAADYTRLGSTAVGAPGPDWHLLGSDDYSGDGMNDILWQTNSGQIAIWDMNGTHITAAAYTRTGATNVGAPGPDWHLFEHHYDLV